MRPAIALALFLLCSVPPAGAREPTAAGHVLDEAGVPIARAHVMSAGGDARGVLTAEDGTFRLPHAEGELIVRALGFRAWRGSVDPERPIEIRMTPAVYPIEGVETTAHRRPSREAEHTTPVSRIAGEALWGQRSTLPVLADRLRTAPEVTTIGRDDYNAAPAVRGLARFRTVLLFDGVRIQSDREIGPSAGFLDPAMLERVEVVRGPGSVLYGSDAIGGVVSLRPYAAGGPERAPWIETGYSSANDGFRSSSGGSVAIPGGRAAFSLAHARAGDYALPGSSLPWKEDLRRAANSGFERSAGQARLTRGPVEYAAFYSLGEEIGRPAREAERFTVEREEHVIHAVHVRGGDLPAEGHLYLHPNRWRATVVEPTTGTPSRQVRNYSSTDWGGLATRTERLGALSALLGVQVDARSGVDIVREVQDQVGVTWVSTRLDRWVADASSGAAGALGHVIFATAGSRLQVGARLDRTWRQGRSGDEGRFVVSGQAGYSRELGPSAIGSLNVATAYREPTVTELFFAGRRPAGYLEGNPALAPERSYQVDAGVKGSAHGVTLSASAFLVAVRDFITLELRASGAVDTLRYANAARATLYGGSLEARTTGTWHGLAARLSLDAVRGEDRSGVPFLDLHGPRAIAQLLHAARRFDSHLTWRGALKHDRPGRGETARAGYGVLDVGTQVRIGPTRTGLTLQNVLDQEFYERGEPVAYPSPSRSLLASIRVEL